MEKIAKQSMIFGVTDPSGVGAARRAAAELARTLGFCSNDSGRLALVVTEAATNITKHARGGNMVIQQYVNSGVPGIEVLAVDSGPGNSNIHRCLADGYSTAGTAGNGLGAIRRMSDTFDIFSVEGVGTIVLSHIYQSEIPKTGPRSPQFGAICDPFPGEQVCGDTWSYYLDSGRAVVLIADGLGHGLKANEASAEALRLFRADERRSAVQCLDAIHLGIQHTRGCAVSVAEVNFNSETVNYCGIGNVAGCTIAANNTKRSMVSMNGIAGHNLRRAKDFSYPFAKAAMLIMHSDGIDTRWDLGAWPGIERHHPSVIAAALFRGHRRQRDDATVVVMKSHGGR